MTWPGARVSWLRLACLVIAASFISVGRCRAQDARDFNADTPGKSYTPYTVAQGYYQLESETFHIVEMGTTQTIETLDPVFKYGLTSDFELEVMTTGLLNMQSTQNGRTVSLTGFGDVVPGFKWNVVGNDRGVFSAALKVGLKIPTASAGLGNGAVEYYIAAPMQVALPFDFSLQLQEEVDILKNQADTGHNFSYSEDVSLGRSFGKVSVSLEAFAQSATDPDFKALYTADVGVGYALTPVVVLSFGTYFGLNRYAPKIEAYTGFGFRF